MRKRWYFYLIFCGLCIPACKKFDFERIPFVEINSAEAVGLHAVLVSGTIRLPDDQLIDSYGFVWAEASAIENPTRNNNQGSEVVGQNNTATNGQLDFELVIEPLKVNTRYAIRAFAEQQGQLFYPDQPLMVSTGLPEVTLLELNYLGNSRLQLTGQLQNIEAAGITANDHGFCWSVTNRVPTAADQCISLSFNSSELPFSQVITLSEEQATYYFSAYAELIINEAAITLFSAADEVLSFDNRSFLPVADFPGAARADAVGFSIGDRGYLGTGNKGGNEFWAFDPLRNQWESLAKFKGTPRSDAVAFVIGDQAYLGLGSDKDDNRLNDFWTFHPEAGWDSLGTFPGEPRGDAVAFVLDNKAYVGTGEAKGNNNLLKDFWRYDPENSSWTPIADFPGTPRKWAIAFTIGGKAYVGTGNDGSRTKDFWSFDPDTQSWTAAADFGGSARHAAFAFTLGNSAYIVGGNHGSRTKDFWRFTVEDGWSRKADFNGEARSDATGFVIANHGYMATGRGEIEDRLRDCWVFEQE